jgi:HSP90 family molecular chaperone
METIKTLQFRVAFGAVRHFGRNLYSTNPPAIAELVANAWDAYAKECRVYIKNDSMLIIDNGIGMTDWEFQNRYATSGNEKDTNIRKPEEMKQIERGLRIR